MTSSEWNFSFLLVGAERGKRIKPFSNAVLTACWKKAYEQLNRAILFLHLKKERKKLSTVRHETTTGLFYISIKGRGVISPYERG
jgi:hypothetical protein